MDTGQNAAEIKTFSSSKHNLGREDWTFGGLGDTEFSQVGTGCRRQEKVLVLQRCQAEQEGAGGDHGWKGCADARAHALTHTSARVHACAHRRTHAQRKHSALLKVTELQVQTRVLTVCHPLLTCDFPVEGWQAGASEMPVTPQGQA